MILDIDSSVSPIHGDQESTAYNGHFGRPCDHPFSCSTTWAIWSGVAFSPATRTVPTAGAMSWSRSLKAARNNRFDSPFSAMPRLPRHIYSNTWNPKACATVAAQGKIRHWLPIVLPFSAIYGSHLGKIGFIGLATKAAEEVNKTFFGWAELSVGSVRSVSNCHIVHEPIPENSYHANIIFPPHDNEIQSRLDWERQYAGAIANNAVFTPIQF
jgi:hypothetical protein